MMHSVTCPQILVHLTDGTAMNTVLYCYMAKYVHIYRNYISVNFLYLITVYKLAQFSHIISKHIFVWKINIEVIQKNIK